VAARATFDLAPSGRLSLADEQPPPVLEPAYRGEAGKSSLRLDSDLLAWKLGTDVVVDAHAYAPGGKPARAVEVSLRADTLEKTLVVFGPRSYRRGPTGLTTTAPEPFSKHPIIYEWAFGGSDMTPADPARRVMDARNPVGKGVAADERALFDQDAHRVEYPGKDPAHAGPAGFGPLASFWSPRLERAGTYDAEWERSRRPLLPVDYDDRFGLSSPDDQRPPRPLRGGERIQVTNMAAEGVVTFDLPKIYLAFSTHVAGRVEEHRATLTTVFLALEERQVSLVWQSALQVSARDVEHLKHTSIDEKRYIG
jgi:hypothetical protein